MNVELREIIIIPIQEKNNNPTDEEREKRWFKINREYYKQMERHDFISMELPPWYVRWTQLLFKYFEII